ncbi:MAG: hypothetical protein PHE67_05870 [Campylobacterales bacterium]|nr:hypothetical protein [Campylobacterales bacterium]
MGIFGYIFFKDYGFKIIISNAQKTVFLFLAVATFWFYFEAVFISNETLWALKELVQWSSAIVCFILGFFVANIENKMAKTVFFIVLGSILVHVFYIDFFAIKYFVSNNGVFAERLSGLTEGPDKANYITNWALALVGAELYFRLVKKQKLIPVDNFLLGVILISILMSSYVERMRFGFIGLAFTFIGFLFLYFSANKAMSSKKKMAILFFSLSALFGLAYASYKLDSRWQTLGATLPVALDTEHNKAWLNKNKYPWPTINGSEASLSNYERPAWAKEGLILIVENPLGVGYGRNAFGHALNAKYGEGAVHSHSGIIDLGIGTGIPGMIFWVVFLGSLIYYGFSSFKKHGSYFGMALFFIASGFFFRMLVDSVIRDHMLEQFMFLAGFLLTMSVREIDAKNSVSEV